ncbi:MAG: hypothetical protein II730_11440, partial [Bacteroidales bacterium]|nr:hypothetical protein [Bacteroidales bacterium]
MTLRQVLTQVQADLVANLNDFISATQLEDEDWFTELTFHDDAPRVDTDRYFMGIYLSSPDGEVYTGNASSGAVGITLDCILDDARENSNLPQLYLSAIIAYLKKKCYGVSSSVTTAVVLRTDLEAPVNG